MKKIFVIALALFFGVSVAFADEVDEGLSGMASEQVRSCAGQMIQLGVDSDHALKMTGNMLKNQFREEQILRAQRMIMNAKKEGLPVEPLMEKAYEGMTKRIQAEKILQAMEKVRSRYRHAGRQADVLTEEKGERRRIRKMIAQCLAAGLNDKEVETITHKLQEMAQEMTKAETHELAGECFMAARDITRLGATSMAATDVVWQALDNRYDAKNMKTMRHSFITHMRYTSSATDLAGSYADSISLGVSPEMLWSSSRIEAAGSGTQRAMGSRGSGSGGRGSGSGGGSGVSGGGGVSGSGGVSGGGGGSVGGGVSGGGGHGGRR
jgi:hypothetical protein